MAFKWMIYRTQFARGILGIPVYVSEHKCGVYVQAPEGGLQLNKAVHQMRRHERGQKGRES